MPDQHPRRRFLQRILIGLGGFVAGIGVARAGLAEGPPPASFDFWKDAPVDMVIPYDGSLSAHENLPGGASPKWDVIAVDRALLGADSDIGNAGTEGGAESLASEAGHSGTAVATHSTAGGHTHDAHTVITANQVALATGVLNGPLTHANQGGHTHDAHSVTQPDTHAIKKFHRSYLLKKVVS